MACRHVVAEHVVEGVVDPCVAILCHREVALEETRVHSSIRVSTGRQFNGRLAANFKGDNGHQANLFVRAISVKFTELRRIRRKSPRKLF